MERAMIVGLGRDERTRDRQMMLGLVSGGRLWVADREKTLITLNNTNPVVFVNLVCRAARNCAPRSNTIQCNMPLAQRHRMA